MKLIKWLENNQEWNNAKLAEHLGVDRSTVHKYCTGARNPNLTNALKIEKLTKGKVTCKDLLSDSAS